MSGAQFGAFFYNVVNDEGESYTLYTISGVPREMFSKFPMPRNTHVFNPTFTGESNVRSDDITKEPRFRKNPPYYRMPNGHLPVTSYLAVPVKSREGEVIGGLFFGHEEPAKFTEWHEQVVVGIAAWAALAMDNARLFQEQQRALHAAEQASRAKSDFLATMSHELRTPLNAMIGYSDLLMEGIPVRIPQNAMESVKRIGLAAHHLLELIEEILTFSRLEAGYEDLHLEWIDVGHIVDGVAAISEPLAMQRGLEFRVKRPESRVTICADHKKVKQILLNLISNAVKFTEQGYVGLEVEVGETDVVFTVCDSGIGIDAAHLENIFEPFWQADSLRTRRAGGTGLGLSVSRRLARLLRGDVEVTSEVGKGTRFNVRVPINAS
jgi:signal transduction histidine kinase